MLPCDQAMLGVHVRNRFGDGKSSIFAHRYTPETNMDTQNDGPWKR